MTDINFTGGFLIRNTTSRKWNNIVKSIPGSKNVFEKINEEGDRFIATQSFYDNVVASLLLRRKIDFTFYPNINTKQRFDTYFPEDALKKIEAQDVKIDTIKEIKAFIKKSTDIKPVIISKYKWKPEDHIEKTLKALDLDPKDYKTPIIDGVTYIKDKQGKIVAMASPNNQRGVNFVYKYRTNSDDSSERFALTQGGEKHIFGPLQIINFQKKFIENVKIDLGRKRSHKNER